MLKFIPKVAAFFENAKKYVKIFYCIEAAINAFNAEAKKQGLIDGLSPEQPASTGDSK
jgi:hypothetical protein